MREEFPFNLNTILDAGCKIQNLFLSRQIYEQYIVKYNNTKNDEKKFPIELIDFIRNGTDSLEIFKSDKEKKRAIDQLLFLSKDILVDMSLDYCAHKHCLRFQKDNETEVKNVYRRICNEVLSNYSEANYWEKGYALDVDSIKNGLSHKQLYDEPCTYLDVFNLIVTELVRNIYRVEREFEKDISTHFVKCLINYEEISSVPIDMLANYALNGRLPSPETAKEIMLEYPEIWRGKLTQGVTKLAERCSMSDREQFTLTNSFYNQIKDFYSSREAEVLPLKKDADDVKKVQH